MKLLRHLPRFQQAERAQGALAERERWMRGEIEAYQLESINRVWRHAAAHVPYYRRLADSLKLPQKFASLAEYTARMPVLTKRQVIDERLALLSDQAGRGSWLQTGGSTGPATGVFWNAAAHRAVLAARYRFYATWELDVFDRFAYLWGHAGTRLVRGVPGAIARGKLAACDWLRNRIRLSAHRLDQPHLREYLRRIAAFKPAALYAYATAAQLLAREAVAENFSCDSLKAAILTSEPVYPQIAREVRNAFRVPVVIEYGSIECGLLAGQAPDGTLRVRDDMVVLETAPEEFGHYSIIVTVLSNPAFPLLRYAIGDVTDAPLSRPAQGFSVLANVMGRANDFVTCRSGELRHPVFVMDLFEQFPWIGAYRVLQRGDGSVHAEVELRETTAAAQLTDLQRLLEREIEGYPVAIERVERLSQTAAGKHRWIQSELTARRLAEERMSERATPAALVHQLSPRETAGGMH